MSHPDVPENDTFNGSYEKHQVSQMLILKVPSGLKLRQSLELESTAQVLPREHPNSPSLGGW